MRGGLSGLVLVMVLAGTARADRLTDMPDIGEPVKMSTQIKHRLTLFSEDIGVHLSALSAQRINVHFNAFDNRAKVSVDTGDIGDFSLGFYSDIKFANGYARISTTIDLSVVGYDWELELPDIDMIPRNFRGQNYVELRLPLIKGSF